MLFACMMADAGTPWRREIVSMFSPCATMIAVPPSQLQFCGGWRGCDETEPVTSWRAGGWDVPPPYEGAGSAEVSTFCVGAGCGRIEPVTSLEACGLAAYVDSMNRSLLQPA